MLQQHQKDLAKAPSTRDAAVDINIKLTLSYAL
jgi:hypothetical protein